jgi:hypothetical protein
MTATNMWQPYAAFGQAKARGIAIIDDHAGQAFPIFSDGGRQSRGRAVMRNENLGQYEVGDARKEQHQTVERAIGNGAL